MSALFKKLNYSGQPVIFVENAPDSFTPTLGEMEALTTVKTSLAGAKDAGFVMAFATRQAEVDRFAARAAKATTGDAIVWIAYPKGTSQKHRCEFNRDTGWAKLGELGFEPVRQVAIDEDWSALRFRRVEFIKKMTRSFALSEAGRAKSQRD